MQAGQTIAGRYELVERIGAGGMGEVWSGRQTKLGRAIAIKIIRRENDTPDLRARFAREAELAAKVDHRNVVHIIEYGETDDGDQYLVMPLLKGESLEERLAANPPPMLGEILTWVRGILGGLAAIHDAGIVHRDLKPANVFLSEDADGVLPKLLDFGISRTAAATSERSNLTGIGTAIGTPKYMAPEQFESAREVDQRADIYGVGAILYEALTSKPPFDGHDAFAVYRAVLEREPTPLTTLRADLPEDLCAIVHRALARDRADRFKDARAMRDAIDALASSGTLDAKASAALARSATPSPTLGVAATTPAEQIIARTMPVGKKSAPKLEIVASAESTAKDSGANPTRMLDDHEREKALADSRPSRARRKEPGPPTEEDKGGSRGWLFGGIAIALVGAAVIVYFMRDSFSTRPVTEDGNGTPVIGQQDPDARSHRIAGPDRLDLLALAWARLEEADRSHEVRLVPAAGRWTMVTAPDVPAADAARLAAAFDATAEPAAWDAQRGLRPALRTTTVRLNLHAEPDIRRSPTLRTMPSGALVVALHGSIDGSLSSEEGESPTSYVVSSLNDAGWASPRFLEPVAGCLPRIDRMAADAHAEPELVRDNATVVRTHVDVAGTREQAFVVAVRDRRTARSFVAVYRAGTGCELADLLSMHDIEGVLDEFFFTETATVRGQSLLVASWHPSPTPPADGMMEWAVYRLDEPEPVFADRFTSASSLPRRRQTVVSGSRDAVVRRRRDPRFVLCISRPDVERAFYMWNDTTIVPEVAAAPVVEAPEPEPETHEEEEETAPE